MRIPYKQRKTRGLTLIELMVTVTIIGIIAAVAAPYVGTWIDQQRAIGGLQGIVDQIQTARSEAIKKSTNIGLTISPTTSPWYVGVSKNNAPCTNDNSDTQCIRIITGDSCKGCTLVNPTSATTVNYTLRGTTSNLAATTLTLQSGMGAKLNITVSALGLITICTPSDARLGRYPSC